MSLCLEWNLDISFIADRNVYWFYDIIELLFLFCEKSMRCVLFNSIKHYAQKNNHPILGLKLCPFHFRFARKENFRFAMKEMLNTSAFE